VGAGEWAELRFPVPEPGTGHVDVELKLDQSWVPWEVLGMSDTRPLGVAVQRLWLE